MTFEHFKQTVEAAGLQARECSPYHWKILGGSHAPCINVYRGKRGFGFGVGDYGKKRPGNLEAAIRAAGPPAKPSREVPPFEPERPQRQRVGLIRRLWRWLW